MMPASQRASLEHGGVTGARPLREATPAERPRLAVVPPGTHAADQLAHTMRLVKAARFNAATRLEQKQTVSLFTQSMVALYFVGLAVWQAVYFGQIDDQTNRLITFVQLVSSVFTLILGLLEATNDYKMKAHHLHNCALTVSELAQELRIARPSDAAEVQEFRRRYNEALRACPANHARIDFLCAKLESKAAGRAERITLGLRYVLDIYGLYALFLAVPPLIWWVHQ
ncbi:SLATT domain-containing protein [Hyphomicrobium sp.]|uniref:SLATT domain-containing protein n=1 Tax=Hyphomicrobium sp. TaxID=82 RepID=UPI0025C1E7EB|nr:SLATT domain-containing protein [Hyphomicrobium sp.]MCC7250598.1 SLATT domain-containing protein [Hyphomicrobium sp.]